jgi:hypothetical protein
VYIVRRGRGRGTGWLLTSVIGQVNQEFFRYLRLTYKYVNSYKMSVQNIFVYDIKALFPLEIIKRKAKSFYFLSWPWVKE